MIWSRLPLKAGPNHRAPHIFSHQRSLKMKRLASLCSINRLRGGKPMDTNHRKHTKSQANTPCTACWALLFLPSCLCLFLLGLLLLPFGFPLFLFCCLPLLGLFLVRPYHFILMMGPPQPLYERSCPMIPGLNLKMRIGGPPMSGATMQALTIASASAR